MSATALPRTLAGRAVTSGGMIAAVVCVALTLAGLAAEPDLGWASILSAGVFGFMMAVGAALFLAINRATSAGWASSITSVPILISSTYWAPAILLALAMGLGVSSLYPWAGPDAHTNHLIHEKAAWLNVPFFLARATALLLVFGALIAMLGRAPRSARRAIVFLLLFAPAISVSSWDWMMSLEPEWFSTMFAVYAFAGVYQAGIASVIVVALLFEGAICPRLTDKQLHDLGKLLFAFSLFWAYIWYCQYMLIWYAHLPEETGYFAKRLARGWSTLFWLTPIGCFVVPFVALLSARAKQHRMVLLQIAGVALVGRWLDIHVLIFPSLQREPSFPLYALAATTLLLLAMLWLGQQRVHRLTRIQKEIGP